ncbi:MAG: nucleotidyltransferase domain-containing protein [Thermodesulfovibrionales bacterium]|nr:nucleotidyltransferase domain-containing protein [Thermodesulfovibrionales bacterium]
MRLSEKTIWAIETTAKKVFGADCKVIVFGSRTDDNLKGGDIDLLIETPLEGNLLDEKARFLVEIKKQIGEQKIDLIVCKRHSNSNETIIEEAYKTGVAI